MSGGWCRRLAANHERRFLDLAPTLIRIQALCRRSREERLHRVPNICYRSKLHHWLAGHKSPEAMFHALHPKFRPCHEAQEFTSLICSLAEKLSCSRHLLAKTTSIKSRATDVCARRRPISSLVSARRRIASPARATFHDRTFDQSSRGESNLGFYPHEETNSDVEARPHEKFNSSARSTRRYGQAVCSERPHDRCSCGLRKYFRCGHTEFRRIHDTARYHDAVTKPLPTTPPHAANNLRDTRDQRPCRQCVQLHPDGIEPQR